MSAVEGFIAVAEQHGDATRSSSRWPWRAWKMAEGHSGSSAPMPSAACLLFVRSL
jgi:hypothetical protein